MLRNQLIFVREHVEALEQDYATLNNTHTVFKNQTEQTIAQLEDSQRELLAKKQAIDKELAAAKNETPVEKTELTEETVDVLKCFFKDSQPVTEAGVAFICDLESNRARYHIGVLLGRGFIHLYDNSSPDHSQHSYRIMQPGMAYLMDRRLAD